MFHEMSSYQHQRIRRNAKAWKVPVTVIGGFLGAGKTTALKGFLSQPGSENMDVFIREYGVVPIDNRLLTINRERIHVVSDIAMHVDEETLIYMSLDRIHDERFEKFDRLLLETSGIESPEDFIHLFFLWDMPKMYRLGSFITLIDAEYGEQDLDEYKTAVEQAAFADVILINKTDLVDDDKLSRLEKHLRSVNVLADIRRTSYGNVPFCDVGDTELYQQLSSFKRYTKEEEANRSMQGITSYVIEEDRPLDKAKVNTWINELFQIHGSKILRSKGFLNFAGEEHRYEFQAVRKTFHSYANELWSPDEERKTVIVLIGENLPDQAELSSTLSACVAQ